MDSNSTLSSHLSNPNSQNKSASRLARISYSSVEPEEQQRPTIPHLSLDHIPPSPKKTTSPSPLSLRSSTNSLPLQELLLLSPASPLRRSKNRLADRIEMAEEAAPEHGGSRRRCKSRTAQMGLPGCGSPRNNRRSRRRIEMELREDRDLVLGEEVGKPRKRRHSGKSKKEKLSLVPCLPSSNLSPKTVDCEKSNINRIGEMISDLVMWRDVAKSSLWFGFGCLCFLSSFLTKGVTFSIFSMISQIGLLFLGVSFFSNSICHNVEKRNEFKLREEDLLRLTRPMLPSTNLAISKMRELFSGEPSTTLKVAPLLILGAEYGHIITLRRLCAFGFFIIFSIPKLYSCYSRQINQKAECMKQWTIEAWGACSHKKVVAASAATAFWNLSSVKTRIFTAFISLVIIRYCRQHLMQKLDEGETAEVGRERSEQALVVAGDRIHSKTN
ncbi:reticulon-like protein B18 [Durio zibethinus]|uniref:Reticulon-like protein n=1 Tax=Durio zibethinus TaxID=66656 RepID=A0A6P5Z8S3_DURZI|nr:reticulon-like protein B18 [Durio zibethinus]